MLAIRRNRHIGAYEEFDFTREDGGFFTRMAVDLRKPTKASCLKFLRTTLLALEEEGAEGGGPPGGGEGRGLDRADSGTIVVGDTDLRGLHDHVEVVVLRQRLTAAGGSQALVQAVAHCAQPRQKLSKVRCIQAGSNSPSWEVIASR